MCGAGLHLHTRLETFVFADNFEACCGEARALELVEGASMSFCEFLEIEISLKKSWTWMVGSQNGGAIGNCRAGRARSQRDLGADVSYGLMRAVRFKTRGSVAISRAASGWPRWLLVCSTGPRPLRVNCFRGCFTHRR